MLPPTRLRVAAGRRNWSPHGPASQRSSSRRYRFRPRRPPDRRRACSSAPSRSSVTRLANRPLLETLSPDALQLLEPSLQRIEFNRLDSGRRIIFRAVQSGATTMNTAYFLIVAIGLLAVGGAILALRLMKGTRQYVLAGAIVPWILLIPAVTSFESSRHIVDAFRALALNGSGGIEPIAASLREATGLAIFGERTLLASVLVLVILVLIQLIRKAPPSDVDGSSSTVRRTLLVGGGLIILVAGAALSELSLRSRALPLAVVVPAPNGKSDVATLPRTLWAWEHLGLERRGHLGRRCLRPDRPHLCRRLRSVDRAWARRHHARHRQRADHLDRHLLPA